jgi:hypothetical protein
MIIFVSSSPVTATSASEEALVINYQKGSRINLGLTIDPKPVESSGSEEDITPVFLKIYLNGIVSSVILIDDTIKYPTDLNRFEFNCSGNMFDLYGFRAYKSTLTSVSMLQNYISNFASVDTKTQLLIDNNIYDTRRELMYNNKTIEGEYEVSLENMKGKIGCLVVIADALPTSKEYLPCKTIFYEKDNSNREVQ